MARLKAWFIALYPLTVLLLCAHALSLWWRGDHWLWLGVVLVNAPLLTLIAGVLRVGPARATARLPPLILCAWAGAAVTLTGTLSLGDPRPLAWLYAGLGLVGLCLCLLTFKPQRSDRRRGPRPGQTLPSLTFRDLRGRLVSSAGLRGRPTVLLFVRGPWCPLSMAQLRELMRRRPQLERRGARLVLISAQPLARTARLARRLGVSLEWWVDPQLASARALDLIDPGGTPLGLELFGHPRDTVRPTVLITDADGGIRYVNVADHDRVRPEPTAFLRVLDTMTTAPR